MKKSRDTTALAGRLLIGVAAGVSLYLSTMSLAHTSLPGCAEGSACQEVLQSRWAYSFGLPVSFLGLVLYSLMLLLSGAFLRRERTLAGLQAGAAISMVVAGTVWFTALQLFALQSLCGWCGLTHGMATGGVLLLWRGRALHPSPAGSGANNRPGSLFSSDRAFRFAATGTALAAVGLMALGSLSGELRGPEPARNLASTAVDKGMALRDGKFRLEPADYPAIGNSDKEERTAVLLSDYTLPWCLKYQAVLEKITAASPGLSILVLPAARSPQAKEIQRTMLTVFHAKPEAWRSLSALLTSAKVPATAKDVLSAATGLVGQDNLDAAALAHAEKIEEQLNLAASMLADIPGRSGRAPVLPQLYRGRSVLTGAESDESKIIAFLNDLPSAASRPDPRPVLAVLDAAVELSSLRPGEPHDFEVRVENRGAAPLRLGWVVLDEGCAVTRMPEGPLPPGKITAIGLRFQPPASGGSFKRRLQIHSNAAGGSGAINLHGNCPSTVAAAKSSP